MGMLFAVVFFVGCIVLALIPQKRPGHKLRRMGRFGLFLILFLFVETLFVGLWEGLVWGRLYYSTSDVSDFSPFWPITQGTIDYRWGTEPGRLLGVTLTELQSVWLLFALSTWVVTILLHRWLSRLISRRQGSPAAMAHA